MNDVVELEIGVSLGDSSLVSYTYSVMDRKLTLVINTWMEKILEISFIDPLIFLDEGYVSIEHLCESTNKKNKLFLDAIEKYEIRADENPQYKLFQFVDVNHVPSMQIVATDFYCKLFERRCSDNKT
jgi:hypothetical protein